MPTYEYECEKCGHGFELFHGVYDPAPSSCPECGGEVSRLIAGGAGVISKQGSAMACGKETPCCGRDSPCGKQSCR